MLRSVSILDDPNVLVGIDTSDDAGVYKLSDNLAIVQTVDFFTPIVDDPYLFGQIAATNALSDIYAMGAKPLTAMNIVAFPLNCIDTGMLDEVLRGGADKIKEAGAALIGGHTVEDAEPKYGLSVTGVADPKRIWTNAGAQSGDILLLTKPIGTGIISGGAKGQLVTEDTIKAFHATMIQLNKVVAEEATKFSVSAATDVTGFGLIGHAYEIANASDVSIQIEASSVPFLPQALELAEMGFVTAGGYANHEYVREHVEVDDGVDESVLDVLFDPQTAGGLLLSVPSDAVVELQRRLSMRGQNSWIIGGVYEGNAPRIIVC